MANASLPHTFICNCNKWEIEQQGIALLINRTDLNFHFSSWIIGLETLDLSLRYLNKKKSPHRRLNDKIWLTSKPPTISKLNASKTFLQVNSPFLRRSVKWHSLVVTTVHRAQYLPIGAQRTPVACCFTSHNQLQHCRPYFL